MAADPHAALAAALAGARQAIARIAAQRQDSERDYGAVVVNQVNVQRVLADQRGHLDRTLDEIKRTRHVAEQAAERARAEGVSADPYLETAAGLLRQAEVVDTARRQLADADLAARHNVARAHELLRANQARLDASLREQLRLLDRLERLEREGRIGPRSE